ncbi:C-type lectin domain family 4 member F-like [Branchiostoma lanceolatum]|uniref:C-type lectin domain family 4 member F-like n=1 Tax=Branchiostoma lanceolatum TaxID=7740 RepID=UPI003451ACA4
MRSHRSCMAAGIAVLISLAAMGLAPLTFIMKEEISEMSTIVDALKRNQDDMRQLSATVDTLKRDQDDMRQLSATVDALKRDQDDMSTTVDALKRDQDDMRQLSTTVAALKRDQDDMSTTVDALKRDQDNMFTTVDALKRDQDDMSTTVDALKRDLDKERSRNAAMEQHLLDSKMASSCLDSYTTWRGTCYKVFNTWKTFSGAAAACREDGGTLAMPRDAETNAFLISLHNAVNNDDPFWFGLHDQREEGSFEWVDGSALGAYKPWLPGQPDNYRGNEDCAVYSIFGGDKWTDGSCDSSFPFICQAAPGRP